MTNRYDPRKNAEGYRDPTPYEAEKNIRRQITGQRSRVAGEHFENMISVPSSHRGR